MTITNANFDDEVLSKQIDTVIEHKLKLLKEKGICQDKISAPLGVLSEKDETKRSLKEIITYGIKGSCAYIEHAAMIGKEDNEIYKSIAKTLSQISHDMSVEDLIALTLKTGEICTKSMALLDAANTEAFGNPEISKVNLGVGKRPGILVSGHDLRDLLELLEQTKDSGIDIYTHGEMLPGHYYPALKKYPHLVGNYGGAWYAQDKEFPTFNGPILMTTNCIVPLQKSYADRIFTTGAVGYPGVPHIPDRSEGRPKDFSRIIELAKKCPPPTQIETGSVTGGFGHAQVSKLMPKILEAIKAGKIKRFVVMSGCDGRHKSREYFTEIAKALPKDSVILTSGCAKFRFIKLDLGDIDGIPRVLDAGQCNDSYSLAVIAMKLQKELGLDNVNKLPLFFDVGWYEQKAVCVLLALLSLGFKNVRIGPTLPAFVSPGVLDVLVKEFGLQGTETVEIDIKKLTQ